jgi:glycosyltransferase involved in cell wall biosynthesis
LFPDVSDDHKLVAFVANMNILVKGHEYMIEAARTIGRVCPETRIALIGDGRQRPKLEQMVREQRVQAYFLFLGRRPDVPELLSCCDLSVLASTAEGLPNTVLESMAAGLPVVATQVGGTPEIVEDGVTGLLVPPRDTSALAQAVIRLLENPALAKRLALAGQEHVRTHFSFDRLISELDGFYLELLAQKGRVSRRVAAGV